MQKKTEIEINSLAYRVCICMCYVDIYIYMYIYIFVFALPRQRMRDLQTDVADFAASDGDGDDDDVVWVSGRLSKRQLPVVQQQQQQRLLALYADLWQRCSPPVLWYSHTNLHFCLILYFFIHFQHVVALPLQLHFIYNCWGRPV